MRYPRPDTSVRAGRLFVALKTLSDLGWLLPQGEVSSEPPGWVAWIGRLKGGKNGESFTDYWRRTHEAEVRVRQENEETIVREIDRGQ